LLHILIVCNAYQATIELQSEEDIQAVHDCEWMQRGITTTTLPLLFLQWQLAAGLSTASTSTLCSHATKKCAPLPVFFDGPTGVAGSGMFQIKKGSIFEKTQSVSWYIVYVR
jgi:hypothetical protein